MARHTAKHNGGRTFLQSFLISFLIFGSIFAIAYLVIIKSDTPANTSNSDIPIEDDYVPDEKDDMTVLLVGCVQQNLSPQFYMLLKFDAVENQVDILSIPKETNVTVNVKTKTLAGHYEFGGMQNSVKAAANLLLIDVDKYIRMDQAGIKEMVDYFGGIQFDLPNAVQTESYTLKAGEQLLDGIRVAELMLKGDTELNAKLMATYITSGWNKESLSRLSHYTETLFEISDTDLTKEDIQFHIKPINQLFKKETDKAKVFLLNGTYSDHKDTFDPDTESVEKIKDVFGDHEIESE